MQVSHCFPDTMNLDKPALQQRQGSPAVYGPPGGQGEPWRG